jgi:hypothetical protein
MSMTAADLAARKSTLVEPKPGSPEVGKRNEKVWKFFTPQERIDVIKANTRTVSIGHGAERRDVTIQPMNVIGLAESYGVLRKLIGPILEVFSKTSNPSIPVLIDALGENISELPSFIAAILKRGNNISTEWINEHFDVLLDLQTILPIFIEQNGLEKVFNTGNENGAASAPIQTPQSVSVDSPTLTVVSPPASTSSADGTEG